MDPNASFTTFIRPGSLVPFFIGFFFAALLAFAFRRESLRNLTKSLVVPKPTVVPPLVEAVERVQDILTISLADIHNPREFVVLVFGPALISRGSNRDSVTNVIAQKRSDLRTSLENLQFNVLYGEDLQGMGGDQIACELNVALKERLVARKAHAILVLASSIGSAAEVGIFSQDPALCRKMVIAIHQDHAGGFLAQGAALEAEALGARIITYSHDDLASCRIQTSLVKEALRLYQGLLSRKLIMRPNL